MKGVQVLGLGDLGLADEVTKARNEKNKRRFPLEGHIARLRDDAARLDEAHVFTEGQLVDWKKGMMLHDCGPGPFIFRRRLTPALAPTNDPSNVYFCEPQDCVVGALVARGDAGDSLFCEWVVASRRLEPFVGEHEETQGAA
jgi:hypothetical protein